jgi:hypothetical protein
MGRIRFSEDEAREAVRSSRSVSEALRTLGYRVAGGNYRTLKKYIAIWGISTDHFDEDWSKRGTRIQTRIPLSHILVEHSTYSRTHLKERLLKEGLKLPRCELCLQDENWRGRRMSLILDHINGVGDDNRLENLRIVCPNCAATFDTHCGRKNLKLPTNRECARCGNTFTCGYASQRYCTRSCASRAPDPNRGIPRPERRKAERPPRAKLEREIAALGYAGTGRKYGVSDNAVRKWVLSYVRHDEVRANPSAVP